MSRAKTQKRWMALEFKSAAADVIMIQETHFRPGGSFKLASKTIPNCLQGLRPFGEGRCSNFNPTFMPPTN